MVLNNLNWSCECHMAEAQSAFDPGAFSRFMEDGQLIRVRGQQAHRHGLMTPHRSAALGRWERWAGGGCAEHMGLHYIQARRPQRKTREVSLTFFLKCDSGGPEARGGQVSCLKLPKRGQRTSPTWVSWLLPQHSPCSSPGSLSNTADRPCWVPS